MLDKDKMLVIIPARGGSKGIPGKNIKQLAGKSLIYYSIDIARGLTVDDNICVSTDDSKIIDIVENYGLKVPFKRPDEFATDEATTNSVLLHAINFYESKGLSYDIIVLLQPTSPLRTIFQVKEAIKLFDNKLDMVVSVKKSHLASVLCNEDEDGFLVSTFNKSGKGRQFFESYFEYNGAIYIINVKSLKEKGMSGFDKVKKYEMDELHSVDIDNELDWKLVELIINK